ncbi:uncharacterized protein UDID_18434 [Ustilago sp. UG-2017a]|nr:uncharacterized protein UDID_18434 [Ustilago sp. UG-2017a]
MEGDGGVESRRWRCRSTESMSFFRRIAIEQTSKLTLSAQRKRQQRKRQRKRQRQRQRQRQKRREGEREREREKERKKERKRRERERESGGQVAILQADRRTGQDELN